MIKKTTRQTVSSRVLRPTKTICVDVDGTLISKSGHLNNLILEHCEDKKAAGFDIVLWSARGRVYAEEIAKRYKIEGLFFAVIGKPGYIFDDLGWLWTRNTVVLKNSDLK